MSNKMEFARSACESCTSLVKVNHLKEGKCDQCLFNENNAKKCDACFLPHNDSSFTNYENINDFAIIWCDDCFDTFAY